MLAKDCKMPPGDEITGGEIHLTGSKSRRFLDSIFHSKRTTGAHHRRGASLDSSIPSSRPHWHPRFCEATQQSVRPVSAKSVISEDKEEKRKRASLWVRIVGRIAGKSRVVEEKPSSKKPSKRFKWVSCEDLSRVISSDKGRCSHDELIKPVLEPVRFEEATRRKVIPPDQRVSTASVVARALATTHPRGAITPLVAMLDSPSSRSAALLTLHALASGNDANKAAIVDAPGAVPKMLSLLETDADAADLVVANLVSLSALDRNKPLLASAIPPLVARLRRDALRALYNLSLAQSNVKTLVESNAAAAVMGSLTLHLADEKALAILGNMVATPVGRNSVASSGIEPLMGALGTSSGIKCQERAAYILMVIAHHSPEMVERRAIPALLEVSLLGSALAQKRAVRVLECLRQDHSRPVSAPMPGHAPRKTAAHSDSIPKVAAVHDQQQLPASGSKIVNHMVRESLERNLERIVRRANLPAPLDHVRHCSTSSCTSSKSLPFYRHAEDFE